MLPALRALTVDLLPLNRRGILLEMLVYWVGIHGPPHVPLGGRLLHLRRGLPIRSHHALNQLKPPMSGFGRLIC